jgi:hypothetical protein
MSKAATSSFSKTHHYRPGQQQPNRFTQSFSRMKEVCPNAIKTYASCVLDAEDATGRDGGAMTTKHSCSKEFRSVKECFKKVRGF